MTTNFPNPVDGDVQALIAHIKEVLQEYEEHGGIGYGEAVYRTALAALTADPVGWQVFYGGTEREFFLDKLPAARLLHDVTENGFLKVGMTPLYTTPPAQLLRPVELPAKATAETFGGLSLAKAYGWNACLAEVQRLNAAAQMNVIEQESMKNLKWLFDLSKTCHALGIPLRLSDSQVEKIAEAFLELEQRLNATAQPVSDGCKWSFDDTDGFWESACGSSWVFNDGGPIENEFNFCQKCGGKVILPAAPGGQDD